MRGIGSSIKTGVMAGIQSTGNKATTGKFGKRSVSQMQPNSELATQLNNNTQASFVNGTENKEGGSSNQTFASNNPTDIACAKKGITTGILGSISGNAKLAFSKSLIKESGMIHTMNIPADVSLAVQTIASNIRSMDA